VGHITARRARRTGSVFWGCSRYPRCDFTSSREPLGALHDADDGPVAREGEKGICLRCGAPIDLPEAIEPATRLSGGEPNPAALAAPRRGRRSARPKARATSATSATSATRRRARPAAA
jgi:ssDNA-binding Zn-finger/Zn-ribbon topoisomerase 1